MQKRLVPVGNSLALIIDKAILELLHVDRDTPVELRVEGEKLIIGAVSKSERRKRIKEVAKQVFDKHASTMAKLAK